jgi:SAM-dependent methyltransferase
MPDAAELAQAHWNETPLFLSEDERYATYPWLYQAAEFGDHRAERVLEIGCGSGSDLLQFAKHGAVATGIDLTEKHIELARRLVGSLAAVHRADARHLPFEDESFDYVYSHGVLHHSDEPEKIAYEIFRVLRPGGRFNVHVYALWSVTTLDYVLQFGRRWKQHIENGPAPVYIDLYTSRKLRMLFGRGITIERHECPKFKFLASRLGWFLVAKGRKT